MTEPARPQAEAVPASRFAEMEAICARALPDHALGLHLRRTPRAPAPRVVFDGATPGALPGEELASAEGGNRAPGAPRADIYAWAKPYWDEMPTGPVTEGAFRFPVARALFRFSPLGFEFAKYALEWFWRSTGLMRGRWPQPGAPVAVPQGLAPVNAGAAPAAVIAFNSLEHGGAEKLAFDTVAWARAAGLRVFVVAGEDLAQTLAWRLPGDVTFLRADRYLPPELWGRFLVNLARAENVRLLHIHHCEPAYGALPDLKAALPGVTVVDSTHIIEHRDGGYAAMAADWSPWVDVHQVISHDLGAHFARRGAGDKVLLGRLLNRADAGGPLRPFSLNPVTGRLTVAFVGRMSHQKRPLLMARILRELADWARGAGIDLRFEAVGEGPYLSAFRELLVRSRLMPLTTLHPADADVPGVMGRADILLIPSANEGLALVGYEAIRAGTIPISTDVGAQGELIPPELLLASNPLGLARRTRALVARLWTDPAFRAHAEADLTARMEVLAAEPTAQEVLMPIYRAAAGRPQP